jgi:hypothetical protein
MDLSVGWGSNSQWRTCFRRDYQISGVLFYNVDADGPDAVDLAAPVETWPQDNRPGGSLNPQLSVQQRRELLMHRCFVTGPEPTGDCWPYDDYLRETPPP